MDPLIIKVKRGKKKFPFRRSLSMEDKHSVTKSLSRSLIVAHMPFPPKSICIVWIQCICWPIYHINFNKLQYIYIYIFFTSHVLTLRWKRHDISTKSPPTPCVTGGDFVRGACLSGVLPDGMSLRHLRLDGLESQLRVLRLLLLLLQCLLLQPGDDG